MKASIIIASYNVQETIVRCLQSLENQDTSYPYEIIVIDSSADNTPEIIKKTFPLVRLIQIPKKIFPGKCRNIGIKSSSGEIISFLPADCFVPSDWLLKRIRHHDNGFDVVSSSIDNGNPQRLLGWVEFFCEFSRQMHSKKETIKIVTDKGYYYLSYSRKIYEQLGSYEEHCFSGEDTEFLTRIINNNIPILYDPDIVFYHINNSSVFSTIRHQYIHGRDTGARMRKSKHIDSNFPFKLLLPLYFPFLKYCILLSRIIRKKPDCFFRFFILSPLIVFVLLQYSIGYYYGYFLRINES